MDESKGLSVLSCLPSLSVQLHSRGEDGLSTLLPAVYWATRRVGLILRPVIKPPIESPSYSDDAKQTSVEGILSVVCSQGRAGSKLAQSLDDLATSFLRPSSCFVRPTVALLSVFVQLPLQTVISTRATMPNIGWVFHWVPYLSTSGHIMETVPSSRGQVCTNLSIRVLCPYIKILHKCQSIVHPGPARVQPSCHPFVNGVYRGRCRWFAALSVSCLLQMLK